MSKIDEIMEKKVFIVENPNRKKDIDQYNVRVLQLDEVLILMQLAKKQVFDDIEKFNDSISRRLFNSRNYQKLKEHHLSTFQKKSNIIVDKPKSAKFR